MIPEGGVPPPAPAPPWRARRRLLALGIGAAALLLCIIGVRSFILTPFRIASSSMEPSLRGDSPEGPGDTVLVFRLARLFGSPRRWDVVAFEGMGPPEGGEGSSPGRIVKRVVGLPGELVAIDDDGGIVVNGRPAARPAWLEGVRYARGGSFGTAPVLLGPDDYFVLGDNSYPSVDSRRFGPLPRGQLLGSVICIVWPPGRAARVR